MSASIVFFNMLWEMGTLGLLNIVTYLEKNGYPVKHVYLTKSVQETPEETSEILSFIERVQPNLVGFSLMSFNFDRTKSLSIEIKKKYPEIKVLWGGIHPTFDPEEAIQFADFVCIGEGEEASLELVQALDIGAPTDRIPNIWSQQDGNICRNEVRPLIQNLDDHPFPVFKWENTYCLDEGRIVPLSHKLYRKYVMYSGTMYDIMVSRGCPYSCSYCCNSLFRSLYEKKGKYFRHRSVDNVIKELLYVKKEFPYVNMINIQDDGFSGLSEDYIRVFSEQYRKTIGLPLRIRIIPTSLTETKVRWLSQANTLVAVLGIQSNNRINKDIFNRRVTSEQLISATRLLKKYGIVGQYDLIVRNPYEEEEDMIEGCCTLSRLPKPYQLVTYPLALFPNTPLRMKAVHDGIQINPNDGYKTPYGSYPIRFPFLHKLQETCPYTPRFLIDFFIQYRHSRVVRYIFIVYYYSYYKSVDWIRQWIMKNTRLVDWTRRILFLPQTFTFQLKDCIGKYK